MVTPFMNIGPGDLLKEDLEALNWTQEDLAHVLGMTKKGVNEILNNKTPITLESARLLGKAFGQSPQFWLSLSANYRLRERGEDRKEIDAEIKAKIYRHMPVRDMIKKGWLRKYRNVNELVTQVKRFWGMDNLDFSFMQDRDLPAFRKSDKVRHYRTFYAHTWFRMAKNQAEKRKAPPFSKKRLGQIIGKFSGYSANKEGVALFLEDLHACGVKFFVLSPLEKTHIDGASFYDGANPVVVYTARLDRLDHFWSTMAHELAHVSLHLKKQSVFIDIEEGAGNAELKEREADEMAFGMMRGPEILDFFRHSGRYVSQERLLACSKAVGVGRSLIVGILRHHGFLSPRSLNRFKEDALPRMPG